ncbi:MAG: tetratricopeptide repeat protein [Isosphaeraceae bacterium]
MAVSYLENYEPEAPEAAASAFWKGRLLLSAGQYVQAIGWLDQATKADPAWLEARKWLAAACYESGERRRCLAALEQVVKLAPDDASSWLTIAMIHRENLDLEEACEAFARALAKPPYHHQGLLDGAATALDSGRLESCETWLRLLPASYQQARQAEIRLGLLVRQNRLAEARILLDDALKSDARPGPEIMAQAASLNQAEGNLADAERQFSQALAARPRNADWLYQRGSVRQFMGKNAEAAADFESAKAIRNQIARMSRLNDQAEDEPRNGQIRLELGQIAESLEMFSLAVDWYKAALACDPKLKEAGAGIRRLDPAHSSAMMPGSPR